MNHMLETIVGIISSILAAFIGWAIRINNRITGLETYKMSQDEKEEVVKDLLEEKLNAMLNVTKDLDKNVSIKFDHLKQLMEERSVRYEHSLTDISRRMDRMERSMNGHSEKA